MPAQGGPLQTQLEAPLISPQMWAKLKRKRGSRTNESQPQAPLQTMLERIRGLNTVNTLPFRSLRGRGRFASKAHQDSPRI